MSDSKWKNNLLSSSFPLEYETAKILVSKGFSISSEYTYCRNDESGKETDFSVDIHALGFTPFEEQNSITSSLNLLVECKHRARNTKWLFLPDPNEADMSPVTLGRTISIIDNFSTFSASDQSSIEFDVNLEACYKCIEINGEKVYDKEVKHGISQLRYALPRLIKDNIVNNVFGHADDNLPFAYCSILLTTAELYIAEEDLSIQKVEESSKVEDISTKVPYLLFYSDYGPDFKTHCSKQFEELEDLEECDEINIIENTIKSQHENVYNSELPSQIYNGLSNGETFYLKRYFTQFLVCNYSEFPRLLDLIKETVTNDINLVRT